jgi:ribosomal protein S18 acetylase RimI-like enzyme
MPIIVKPIEEADLEEWMEVHYLAFQSSLAILWNSRPSKESFQILAERRKSALTEPGAFILKAVDTEANNKIAGVANWSIYPEERNAEELKKSLGSPLPIPEVNHEAREAFMSAIDSSREEIMGTAPVVMLGSLIVRPEYQRKGVGTMLMKPGLEEADR